MTRRRSRIARKLQLIRQFWIIIGKTSATGQESALRKFDPNLQPRWTSGRRITVLRTYIRRQKGESIGCAKFVSRCSSERLMKKERNCTNFDNRMPMFGSPALPTHKVAERVEVVLRIPSFSLLASWGEVFRHFAGPSDNHFPTPLFRGQAGSLPSRWA